MSVSRKLMSTLKISIVSVAFVAASSVFALSLYKHLHPVIIAKTPVLVASKPTTPATVAVVKTVTTKTVTPTPTPVVTPKVITPKVTTVVVTTPQSTTPTPTTVTTTPTSSVNTLTPAPPASTPQGSSNSYTSTNWSGYLATGGNYTAISSSWVVPSVTGNGSSTTGDGTWVGIGGVSSSDLIQVGTTNFVSASGQVTTSAFYEMLPDTARTILTMTVSAGDSISASLIETSSGIWSVSITDNTTSQTYSTSVSYASTNSSAEWIEEDPSYSSGSQVPFDEFGSVNFSGASVTSATVVSNLTQSNASPITLENTSGQTLASPSSIGTGGANFTVTRSN
jgi:hypothetical protein